MGRTCVRLWLQFCLMFFLIRSCLAEGVTSPDRISPLPEGAYVIQVLGYIVAILILLGAGLLVLFKGGYVGGLRSGGKIAKKLQIEETRMLGHRQYLIVAEYEGRRMLIGVCPGRIDYLCPLDAEIDERDAAKVFGPSKTEL